MLNKLFAYYLNALTAISEINRGEWQPERLIDGELYEIVRKSDGKRIWVANGSFFCDAQGPKKFFGLIFRHLVWWGAAKWYKRKIEAVEIVRL